MATCSLWLQSVFLLSVLIFRNHEENSKVTRTSEARPPPQVQVQSIFSGLCLFVSVLPSSGLKVRHLKADLPFHRQARMLQAGGDMAGPTKLAKERRRHLKARKAEFGSDERLRQSEKTPRRWACLFPLGMEQKYQQPKDLNRVM